MASQDWKNFTSYDEKEIRSKLNGDNESEIRNALTAFYTAANINDTNKHVLFDIMSNEPESKELIPVETEDLLRWAASIEFDWPTLLKEITLHHSRVNAYVAAYFEEADTRIGKLTILETHYQLNFPKTMKMVKNLINSKEMKP